MTIRRLWYNKIGSATISGSRKYLREGDIPWPVGDRVELTHLVKSREETVTEPIKTQQVTVVFLFILQLSNKAGRINSYRFILCPRLILYHSYYI